MKTSTRYIVELLNEFGNFNGNCFITAKIQGSNIKGTVVFEFSKFVSKSVFQE
jgi:hypothetical protein